MGDLGTKVGPATIGEAGFSFPGGGGDRALRPDPLPKGSIDRTPKSYRD